MNYFFSLKIGLLLFLFQKLKKFHFTKNLVTRSNKTRSIAIFILFSPALSILVFEYCF